MKKDLLVTLADKNYISQAKQLFSSAYWNAGWKGDYMLLSYEIPEEELRWFIDKGILIKRCNVSYDYKIENEGRPIICFSNFYLFTQEIKKWSSVIFLDADIIVRASLDGLTKIKGFAAARGGKLSTQFIKPLFPLSKLCKVHRKIFDDLKKNYNLKAISLISSVMAFDTDIIKEDTFSELQKLVGTQRIAKISRYADQSILSLFFYKKFTPLPCVYNSWPDYMIHSCNIKTEKIKGIILHFMARNKPWLPNSPFYNEWKDNLEKAELIDLQKIPPPRENWTEDNIKRYCLYLQKRHILYFYKHVVWKVLLFIDKIIGLIGIYFKNNFSRVIF